MIIKNILYYSADRQFIRGSLCIEGGVFSGEPKKTEDDVIDGEGCIAIPGLIDLHLHGCMGADFCDGTKEAVRTMAQYEAKRGITSFCPATMTLSFDELKMIMENADGYEFVPGAKLVGINMEGPFINAAKCGAQDKKHICAPNVDMLKELQKASGDRIRIVDIAPEMPGSMAFIESCRKDVVISLAHTSSDYETARSAFEKGASHCTHLFNAMPPLHHRDPGVIGAALDASDVNVELICDGVHLHPSVIRTAFKMFTAERIVLVSDSMRATGLSDGIYTLGGQEVFVRGRTAELKDKTLAGSVTDLMGCMIYAVKNAGIPLEDAIRCASENPAKILGIFDRCGSIENGKQGDVVLLDDNLSIKKVIVSEGKETYIIR